MFVATSLSLLLMFGLRRHAIVWQVFREWRAAIRLDELSYAVVKDTLQLGNLACQCGDAIASVKYFWIFSGVA